MKRSFSVSLDVGWLLPPSRWFLAAAVALVLHSALPTESPAVPLPPRSATASAEASFEGITVGPFLSMLPGNGFVDEMALAFVPGDPSPLANSALATSASFTDLSLHSRSRVFSEDASGSSNEAISLVGNVSHWVASPPAVGTNFDLDVNLSLDGALDAAGAAFTASPFQDELRIEMEILVTLHFPSLANTITAFNGLARLEVQEDPSDPANTTFFAIGDLTNADFVLGDTEFNLAPPFPTFGSRASLSLGTTIQQSVPAELFAVEVWLRTAAEGAGVFEEGFAALADFFDSSEFTLSTNTPGVTINQVPEPGSVWMWLCAFAVLAVRKPDRSTTTLRRPTNCSRVKKLWGVG